MLLTFVLAGKGAKEDVAVFVCVNLIADKDAPFEPWCHLWRFRKAACVEAIQIPLQHTDTTHLPIAG